MTDSPVPVAAHHHPDLSIDQQLALRTASTRLHDDFGEHFGVETVERYPASATTSSRGGATICRTSSRCWPNAGHASGSRPWGGWRARSPTPGPTMLFLPPATRAARRWRSGYFDRLAGDEGVAWSGGWEPGDEIDPLAVAGDGRGRHRRGRRVHLGRGPTRSSRPPTWSSPWAAATPARSFPGKRCEDWDLPDTRWPVRRRGPPDPRRRRRGGPPPARRTRHHPRRLMPRVRPHAVGAVRVRIEQRPASRSWPPG